MPGLSVPFGDLKRQNATYRAEIDAAVGRVLDRGWYILGQEVTSFEEEFATYCGASQCVGVASGADALYLALAALQIGPGDEVITVANACMYQTAAILQTGAMPVLVDVNPRTQNMDPGALAAAITPRTSAVIPVHLFGRLADMKAIRAVASRHGLAVIEDAAQAHGAWAPDADGRIKRAGSWGDLACFSFYPSKNLGALGDGGAVVTDDPSLTERLRRLRFYGWGSKYNTVDSGGRNSRLDEIQAAILRVKLRHLDAANAARRERAGWYRDYLGILPLLLPEDEEGHIYHLFVISADGRDDLRRSLADAGVGCDVHYPTPTHLQPAYRQLGYQAGSLPETERLSQRILSLPMFPELERPEAYHVAQAVRAGVTQ